MPVSNSFEMELPVFGGALPPSFAAQPLYTFTDPCTEYARHHFRDGLRALSIFVTNTTPGRCKAQLSTLHMIRRALQMLNSAQHCLQKRIFATTVPKTLVIGLDLSAPTATLRELVTSAAPYSRPRFEPHSHCPHCCVRNGNRYRWMPGRATVGQGSGRVQSEAALLHRDHRHSAMAKRAAPSLPHVGCLLAYAAPSPRISQPVTTPPTPPCGNPSAPQAWFGLPNWQRNSPPRTTARCCRFLAVICSPSFLKMWVGGVNACVTCGLLTIYPA